MKLTFGVLAFLAAFCAVTLARSVSASSPPVASPAVLNCKCFPDVSFNVGLNCNCTYMAFSSLATGVDCDTATCTNGLGDCGASYSVSWTGSCAGNPSAAFSCTTGCGTECTSQQGCPGGGRLTMTLKCTSCTQI